MLRTGTSVGPRSLVKGPSAQLKGIRDFKTQRRDCTENVAYKINLRSFSLYRNYSYPLTLSKANPPGVEFLGDISKFRKRNSISSLLVYVLHKTRNQAFSRRSRAKTGKEMYKRAWCTCRVVVLVIKPIVFFFFDVFVAVRVVGS